MVNLRLRRGSLVFMLLMAAMAVVYGQGMMDDMKMMKGEQGSFVRQSMRVEQQLVSLAGAVPQDKFDWRPMDGVRSVAEAFLHAATGNYVMLRTLGGTMPEGVDPMKLEKSTTDKTAIVEAMKKSFKAINDYVGSVKDNDLSKEVDFFGNKMSVGDVIMAAATHQHEVLGQSIAYARMNHVVPPWTAARQARMKEAPKN